MSNYNIIEFFDSRKIRAGLDSKTVVFMWLVQTFGDASETDIYNYAFAPSGPSSGQIPLAPYVVDGLNRNECACENIAGPGGIWKIVATYGSNPTVAALDVQNSLPSYPGLNSPLTVGYKADITGATIHITQALATIFSIAGGGVDVIASGSNATMGGGGSITLDGSPSGLASGQLIVFQPAQGWQAGMYDVTGASGSTVTVDLSDGIPAQPGTTGGIWVVYGSAVAGPNGGSAPDIGNVIQPTLDGVAGCDIIIPSLEFTLEGTISPISPSDVNVFYSLVGTVNQDEFWNYAPGECRFDGASIVLYDQIAARVCLKFSCSPSQYNIKVTNTIYIPFKAGWERLSVVYFSDSVNNLPFQVAKFAYTQQVYPNGDFGQLGVD